MRQTRSFLNWLSQLLVTLLFGSFVVFISLYLAPGNPIATLSGGRSLSPAAVQELENRYGLDQPFLLRYLNWLLQLFKGDMGRSILFQTDVKEIVLIGLRTSIPILVVASVATVLIGASLGFIAGRSAGKLSRSITVLFTIGLALPAFVIAPLLLGASVRGDGEWQNSRVLLPTIAVIIPLSAYIGRVVRAQIKETSTEEFVDFAVLRGISPNRFQYAYLMRPALAGIVTASGLIGASALSALLVVEVAFNLNGLGYFLVSAVASNDFALLQGIVLVFLLIFILMNSLIDLVVPLFDPRLRTDKEGQHARS